MNKKNSITSSLKLGTSGYSYDDWKGHFYPREISKQSMLGYYCQFFGTVEINSSYYNIPNLNMVQRFIDQTPEEFDFIIKVNRETTHNRRENEQAMKQLAEVLRPLDEAGKFKGLLAQFPYSFKNNEANRRYLVETKKYAVSFPLFVEFRHASWNVPQLDGFLTENNIGYVNVDEPSLKGLLPAQALTTTQTGYIRFHGRNVEKWWDGRGSERYDYLYSEDELKSWISNIRDILRKTQKTYIFFNNHPRGQAVRNAQTMQKILENQLNLHI